MRERARLVFVLLLIAAGAAFVALRPAPSSEAAGGTALSAVAPAASLERTGSSRAMAPAASHEARLERAREPAPSKPPASQEAADGEAEATPEVPAPPAAEPSPNAPPPAAEEKRRPALSRGDIKAAVESVRPRVKACYERALQDDPSLAGRVLIQFEVEASDGEGVVARGEVPESETFSPVFEACVLQEVAGARFPAPEAGGKVTVRYPFLFDPGGGWGGEGP